MRCGKACASKRATAARAACSRVGAISAYRALREGLRVGTGPRVWWASTSSLEGARHYQAAWPASTTARRLGPLVDEGRPSACPSWSARPRRPSQRPPSPQSLPRPDQILQAVCCWPPPPPPLRARTGRWCLESGSGRPRPGHGALGEPTAGQRAVKGNVGRSRHCHLGWPCRQKRGGQLGASLRGASLTRRGKCTHETSRCTHGSRLPGRSGHARFMQAGGAVISHAKRLYFAMRRRVVRRPTRAPP